MQKAASAANRAGAALGEMMPVYFSSAGRPFVLTEVFP